MDLKQLVREGKLTEAIAAATATLKGNPTEPSARIALFELLCFEGDLERAGKQLEALSTGSMEMAYAATFLTRHLAAERKRRDVFDGKAEPDYLGTDSAWAAPLRQYLATRGTAAPPMMETTHAATKGTLNGKAFAELRDADDLLAPLVEVLVAGRYVWLLWSQVRTLTAEAPRTLRETFWLPVKLKLSSGDSCEGVLPVLYPGSHTSPSPKVRLGLQTDWNEVGGLVRGLGRKTLLSDGEPEDILAVRELSITG